MAQTEIAIVAGGCFWGVEDLYRKLPGVLKAESGYIGGHHPDSTYREVCSGLTGHAEAVRIEFDPVTVSYKEILHYFWEIHDPTTLNRQGPDVGAEYRSAIFYLNDSQQQTAQAYIRQLNGSGKFLSPIVTELSEAGPFYLAEDYHQDYYPQHPENPYVQRITRPKVEKFEQEFASWLKP